MAKSNIIGIIPCICSAIALILSIVACAINFWMTCDFVPGILPLYNWYMGIWEICVSLVDLETVCINTDDITNATALIKLDKHFEFKPVRAMMILGIILSAATIVIGVLVTFIVTQRRLLYMVAAILSFTAGLFLMVAFAVFAHKTLGDYYHRKILDKANVQDPCKFGTAFIFDVSAWLLSWAAGLFFIIIWFRDKSEKESTC